MDEVCKRLPKIELHAHLHGSATLEIIEGLKDSHHGPWKASKENDPARTTRMTLFEGVKRVQLDDSMGSCNVTKYEKRDLVKKSSKTVWEWCVGQFMAVIGLMKPENEFQVPSTVQKITGGLGKDTMTFEQCFEWFSAVHRLIQTREMLERLTDAVVRKFRDDNVIYLELRSTPKNLEDGTTPLEYVRAVIRTLIQCAERYKGISVRYIMSIDRSRGVQMGESLLYDAYDQLEEELRKYVVGVDLAGNPVGSKFVDFEHILVQARHRGLKVTVHCGEIDDPDEVRRIVAFAPDRLGHALFLPEDVKTMLLSQRRYRAIPIECCPTSNVTTLGLNNLREHPHMKTWLRTGYPVAICTDDAGLFNTSLSMEYAEVANTFNLKPADLAQLSVNAAGFAFADDGIKRALQKKCK